MTRVSGARDGASQTAREGEKCPLSWERPPHATPEKQSLLIALLSDPQLILQAQDKILGPPRWRQHAVGHRFLKFFFGGAVFLRDREVLAQSVGAADRYRAGHADHLAGFDVQYFLVFIVENFFADIHGDSFLCSGNSAFRIRVDYALANATLPYCKGIEQPSGKVRRKTLPCPD